MERIRLLRSGQLRPHYGFEHFGIRTNQSLLVVRELIPFSLLGDWSRPTTEDDNRAYGAQSEPTR